MSGGTNPMVSVERIAEGLSARAFELVRQLLPNGVKQGHEWFVGGVSGEKGKSLAVNIGHRPGVWADFATGEGGDAIDLIAAVQFRGDKGQAIRWARSWLGLDGLDPGRMAITRAAVVQKAISQETAMSDDERRDKAVRMWRGAKAWGFKGTPADDYLHGRGISMRQLGRVPGALAFAPQVWNGELGKTIPAMLAAVQIRNITVGVHRTFLEVTGEGQAAKARVANAKLSLGPIRGGVIPLWRGGAMVDDIEVRGLAWSALWDAELDCDWPRCPADAAVTLTEGIEDALSIALADPSRRVVACVSLANMGSAVLPPCLTDVTIAADNDAANSKAATAGLPRAIAAFQRQGRTVRVARPPAAYKDFNAWLQSLQAPAGANAVDNAVGSEKAMA